MPNAAVEIRRAYFLWYASEEVTEADRRLVQALLESYGKARGLLTERDPDDMTAAKTVVMSTADSQLLICSLTIADDIYKAVFRRDATQGELVFVGRLAVLGASVVAVLLAMSPESNVLGLVSYAWAGFGAAFGPNLIASLYWSRLNQWGALAGIIAGGLTVVVWAQLSGGIFDVYEIVLGFVLSVLAISVVTLVTPAPNTSVQRQFASMLDEMNGRTGSKLNEATGQGLLVYATAK